MATAPTNFEIDRMFDNGEDVIQFADEQTIERPNLSQRRISVDMMTTMIEALDAEAARIGINRQALIKVWLQERLDAEAEKRARLQSHQA